MDDKINIKKLTKEFRDARVAEKKHMLENDAKFRAVHQKVASYEEFKDIVAASGLNPLDKKDIYSNEKIQTNWNMMYNSNNCHYESSIDSSKNNILSENVSTNMSTSSMFLKKWRNLKTSVEKKDFLFAFSELQLENIFSKNLPSVVFEDSIQVIYECFEEKEITAYVTVFKGFSKSSRIGLACKFLDKNSKERLKDIFTRMKSVNPDSLVNVEEKFL